MEERLSLSLRSMSAGRAVGRGPAGRRGERKNPGTGGQKPPKQDQIASNLAQIRSEPRQSEGKPDKPHRFVTSHMSKNRHGYAVFRDRDVQQKLHLPNDFEESSERE